MKVPSEKTVLSVLVLFVVATVVFLACLPAPSPATQEKLDHAKRALVKLCALRDAEHAAGVPHHLTPEADDALDALCVASK